MEKTLLTIVNLLGSFVGATIFGFNYSLVAIEKKRHMLYSYNANLAGVFLGSVAHFAIKLLIAAKFFDWYIYD